ncbi:hypothetical protein OHA37_35935 [Streptomyces sp. NBC_00335]|uniref:hypothetical protein n=1 Tax=unclassified Streptomyces TaxID=2593676 RepID=UPI002250963D|nr:MULTISPECIES: hypothetical protein [unclassified Streptomyces]MCX5409233.1 hypothetical protein [Streptomyces sp. NBC_00086]
MLDALARALRLEETERLHLHNPARTAQGPGRRRRPAPKRVTRATGQLLEALAHVPAIVTGRRGDVLVVATTEAGSPARTALALLAHVTPEDEPAAPRPAR